jgi:hypothetical protein
VAQSGSPVTRTNVLDVDGSNPRAHLIADLRSAPQLAGDPYDCIVLTQTLHVIDDPETSRSTARRNGVIASFDVARVPRLDVKRWTREEFADRLDALIAPAAREARVSFLP